MTIPEFTELLKVSGGILTPIIVTYFGVVHGRQNKEILKVTNGTLTAQTHTSAVATAALAVVQPTPENIANANDAAAVLKSRQDGKAAQ